MRTTARRVGMTQDTRIVNGEAVTVKYVPLVFGDEVLHIPIDDKRTVDTLNKRLPTEWVITVEPKEES